MMNLFKRKPDPGSGNTPLPDTPADLFIHSRWLQVFDRFRGLLIQLGVNYPQFRLILGYKLYMDAVDPNFMTTLTNGRRRAGKNAFLRGLWIYALVSLLLTAVIVAMPGNPVLILGSALLYYSTMYMTVLVQAFSGSLLDVRDVAILDTRGVGERTRSAAQTAHILVYVLSLFAALMAIPIVGSFYSLGVLGGILFLVSALVLLVVNYVLSIGIYAVILRFFHGERLKNILSMIQIAILIISVALPQVVNIITQLSSRGAVAAVVKASGFHWYMAIVYPFWFAGPNGWLASGRANPGGILTGLMLAAFILSLFAYGPAMRRLTTNLSKLNEESIEPAHTGWFFRLVRRLVPRSRDQRTFFTLSWRMMQANADYKMRVYPQLASGLVIMIPLALIPFGLADGTHRNFWAALQGSWTWSFLQVYAIAELPVAVYFLRFSQHPEAMKIFATLPRFDKSVLYREAIRTVYLRLAVPLILVLGLITLIFLPPLHVLSNTILALGVGLLMTLLNGTFMSGTAPYSQVFQTGQVNTGATWAASLLDFIIALAAGLLGAFVPWWAVLIVGTVILAGGWVVLGRSFKDTNFILPGEADFN